MLPGKAWSKINDDDDDYYNNTSFNHLCFKYESRWTWNFPGFGVIKVICIVFVRRLVEEVKEKCGLSVETEEVYMNTG